MKTCGRCRIPRYLNHFGICRSRKDGRNLYCKACVLEQAHAFRARKREMREARKRFYIPTVQIVIERKPHVGTKPKGAKEKVRAAIRAGATTREVIQQVTGLHWDVLGGILAELAFESRELQVIRSGDKREFRLVA